MNKMLNLPHDNQFSCSFVHIGGGITPPLPDKYISDGRAYRILCVGL